MSDSFCGIRQRLPAAGIHRHFCCHDCDLVLQTFGTHLNVVEDSKDSILAVVSGRLAPVFRPLGFGDWRVSTALLTGFMAKESVVSTLSVLFGTTAQLTEILTPVSALSLLVFCLLYTPCVAAVASIKRELGGRWAAGVVVSQCVIAWLAAFVVHGFALLFGNVKKNIKIRKSSAEQKNAKF